MQTYKVGRGDSLSQLAQRFGVPVNVLVRFNHKQANPNLIREGEVLRIPWSRAKYQQVIASLEGLKRGAASDSAHRLEELEAIEKDSETFSGRLDLVADLATVFVGMGKAALKYGGTVRRAALRKGTFDAVQKVLVHLGTSEVPEPVKKGAEAAGATVASQYLRTFERVAHVDRRALGEKFQEEAGKSAVKGVAKQVIKGHLAAEDQAATELAVNFVVQAAFTGLKKLDDVAGAVSPSVLAHTIMGMTGENLQTTLEKSRKSIEASRHRIDVQLSRRLATLRDEMHEVYGGH